LATVARRTETAAATGIPCGPDQWSYAELGPLVAGTGGRRRLL